LVIVFADADSGDFERLAKTLDPVGLYVMLRCKSRAEAEGLLEKLEKWT
jgi:hypothetical protein